MKTKFVFLIAIVIVAFSCTFPQKKQEKQQEAAVENEVIEIKTEEEITEALTENEIIKNGEIKEMFPKFGRLLEFSEKDAIEFQKVMDALREVKWDFDKLTDKQREYVKKNNISEVAESYWQTIGYGCSWYCGGGADSISASSHLKSYSEKINYFPKNIHDFSFETAWIPDGNGIGEYLTYHFRQTAPRITHIIIANGYVKSEKAYRENSRVKKIKMYIDDKPFAILNLKDRRQIQIFEFEPIGNGNRATVKELEQLRKLPDWTLKFEILEVYKGDKYEDVAITEIYFDGIDVHCFGAGVKILMSDNSLKNIELIQEGDIVKSFDFENNKLVNSKVTKLISATHSSLLKLKFADNEIITTSAHPFWIDKNVWAAVDADKANKNYLQKTKIESLKIGNRIFIPEKNIFSEILEIENINERQITYTIELSESDNFIANGMLVKTEIET